MNKNKNKNKKMYTTCMFTICIYVLSYLWASAIQYFHYKENSRCADLNRAIFLGPSDVFKCAGACRRLGCLGFDLGNSGYPTAGLCTLHFYCDIVTKVIFSLKQLQIKF